jgi:hypothetical protein
MYLGQLEAATEPRVAFPSGHRGCFVLRMRRPRSSLRLAVGGDRLSHRRYAGCALTPEPEFIMRLGAPASTGELRLVPVCQAYLTVQTSWNATR